MELNGSTLEDTGSPGRNFHRDSYETLCVQGPFVVFIDGITRCKGVDNSNHLIHVNLEISKFKLNVWPSQTLTGNISVSRSIGDDSQANVVIERWINNLWKDAFHLNVGSNLCSLMREHAPSVFLLLSSPDRMKGPCEFSKQFRTYDSTPANWSFPHFNVMPYGQWRFRTDAKMKRSAEPIFCYVTQASILQTPQT